MRATVKYMLTAWAIVAAVCIIVLLAGILADSEEAAGTGFAALIVSACVFTTIGFGMCMEHHAKRRTIIAPNRDPIYITADLPDAERATMAVGTEALRRSLEEQL